MLLPNSKTLKKFLFKKCIYLFIGLCRVLVTAHSIFSCGMWYLNPWPGVKLVIKALYWELGVLATGPAGKPQNFKGTSKYLKVERVSLYSAGKEPTCSAGEETQFDSWVGKIPWRRDRLRTPVFLGFSSGSAGKESTCNSGRPGFDPWVEKIPWRRERLPTLLFWPGEFLHGLYSPWGRKESYMTEQISLSWILKF